MNELNNHPWLIAGTLLFALFIVGMSFAILYAGMKKEDRDD